MSCFAPSSTGPVTVLAGLGLFVILAVLGLGWIEGRFESGGAELMDDRFSEVSFLKMKNEICDLRGELASERERSERLSRQAGETDLLIRTTEQIAALRLEISAKKKVFEGLQAEIVDREAELQRVRRETRARIWPKWLGRPLQQSDLLREIPFRDLRIQRVEESGLVVSHATGVIRIPVIEISKQVREELDLQLSKAHRPTKNARVAVQTPKHSGGEEKTIQPPPASSQTAEISILQKRIAKLRSLISQAEKGAALARWNDRNAKSRSAPRSLETWDQQAKRLEALALSYRNQLVGEELRLSRILGR